MKRTEMIYDRPRVARVVTDGIAADEPVAGLYRMRLKSGAVYSAVRIWFGSPREPWTGEEMDRAHIWNATANDHWIDLERVWPKCTGEPIDQAEYDHLLATYHWGLEHHPDSPQANPFRKADPLTSPLPF